MIDIVDITVFQQVPFETPGQLQNILELSGFSINLQNPEKCSTLVDFHRQSGIVLLGGPMSANDNTPFLTTQLRVLDAALHENLPILGICLGAQLLAKAAGASVYRSNCSEIGFFDITLTPAGLQDGLFGKLNRTETFFHWHNDTFDLPDGAEHLAFSKRTQNQAFRIGDCAYGLQFHPEVTPAMIADWCQQDVNCGDMAEIETPFDPYTNAQRLEEAAKLLFDSWIKLVLNKRTQCD